MNILPFNFAHAAKVLKQRKHARGNLWEFANQTLLKKIPNRVHARHHEVLCHRVQAFMDEPGDGIMIVLMPPGSAKTLFVGHILPAWFMGNHPMSKTVMITNSSPLAERGGRAIRDIAGSKAYDQIFEGVGVSQSSAAVANFQLTNEAEFLALGIGSAIVGRRGDLIVIDDPISGFSEAQSETQLTKLHETYKSVIQSRLTNTGKLILIQQRLARNDLAGFLMDTAAAQGEQGRKLTVLKMPMLCNDEENDPLGRNLGEPLWPEYYTRGMLVDAQADEYLWKTLYQQEPPTDSGTWASSDDIQWMPNPPDLAVDPEYQKFICCDGARSDGSGDFTVFLVVAMHKKTGHLYIADMYRERVNPAISTDKLIALCQAWHPLEVMFEDDAASETIIRLAHDRARYMGVPLPVKIIKIRGKSKEERAGTLRGLIIRKRLHLDSSKPWTRHVIREILAFPHALGSGVDDIIDALALIGHRQHIINVNKPADAASKTSDPRGTFFEATLDELHESQALGRGQRFGSGRI